MRSGVGSAGGHVVFTAWLLRSTHSHMHLCRSTVLSDFAPCPPSLSGKYEVSIMVTLFLQCDVPGGCRSQGCHGCPTTRLLRTGLSWLPYTLGYCAPLSLQAPSPSSSIVDEFKKEIMKVIFRGGCSNGIQK